MFELIKNYVELLKNIKNEKKIKKTNASLSKFFNKDGLKKEYQGYLIFPEVVISYWFNRILREKQIAENKMLYLPLGSKASDKPLEKIVYDKEKINEGHSKIEIISERIWE